MNPKWHALLLVALCGCGPGSGDRPASATPQSTHVSATDTAPRLTDDFAATEQLAHAGVDPAALRKALAGDRVIPRSIADGFARKQRMSEARYWIQVGAENGDGISMQQLSIFLRDQNCVRANYWLEKAIDTGHLPSLALADAQANLDGYRVSCVDSKGIGGVVGEPLE